MSNAIQPVPIESLLAHATWATRVARALTRDRDDADDVVQETWMSAMRRPPDTRGSTLAWLSTVIRRHLIDRARTDNAREQRHHEVAVEATVPSPEELTFKFDLHRRLAVAVDALEEPFRATVLLRYFEGLSSADIARRLGLPAATVRWRLARAIESLRSSFNTEDDRKALRAVVPAVSAIDARSQPPPARMRWNPWVLSIAGVGGVCAVIATFASTDRPSAVVATDPSGGVPAQPAARGNGLPKTAMMAVEAPGPDPCAEVPALRKAVAAAEREALKLLCADKVFARFPEPNPRALAVVTPVIAAAMKAGYPEAEPYTLECREWACLMTVLHSASTPPERINAWMQELQSPALRTRFPEMLFGGAGAVRDPISGEKVGKDEVFLTLSHPEGQAVSAEAALGPAMPPFGPLPQGAPACRNERALLQGRLADAGGMRQVNMPPAERYAAAPPNPALTRRVRAELLRLKEKIGKDITANVECRGQICSGAAADESMALHEDQWFQVRSEGNASSRTVWFIMFKPDEQVAAEIKLRNTFRGMAPQLARSCATSHDPEQKFSVIFTRPQAADGLTMKYAGDGVGTQFQLCAADKIEAALARWREEIPATIISTSFTFRPTGITGPFE